MTDFVDLKTKLTILQSELPDFRRTFLNTLKTLPYVPNFTEALPRCVGRPTEVSILEREFLKAQEIFNENWWESHIDQVPIEDLIQMANNLEGYEIPRDFAELMRMAPDVDPEYVNTQRTADPSCFGNSNI